jgi:hypothetical protein
MGSTPKKFDKISDALSFSIKMVQSIYHKYSERPLSINISLRNFDKRIQVSYLGCIQLYSFHQLGFLIQSSPLTS